MFTPFLCILLVPLFQLCILQNSQHALACSCPLNECITTHQQDTQHCYSTAFHIYVLAMSAILSSTCVSCCRPQQNSISKDINMSYTPSTTHSAAFHKPSMNTANTRHSWQNGTRCRKYCGVMPGWFFKVPSLHALVFIQKTFLWLLYNLLPRQHHWDEQHSYVLGYVKIIIILCNWLHNCQTKHTPFTYLRTGFNWCLF